MLLIRRQILFAFALHGCLAGFLKTADARQITHSEVADVRIENAELTHIDIDSAEFEWRVTGMARKSATIKSIFFQQVTVNGIAIRVPAVQGPLKLRAGQEIQGMPVLTASVVFREVPSLRPLREMVGNGLAHIHAIALVQLDLNPLQMFALRTTNAWTAITIDQDAEIRLPGGLLGRAAALAALTAAEPVWILGNEGREWRRKRSALAGEAEDAITKYGVLIECSYQIRSRNGETRDLRNESFGIVLPSGRILTTAEALEPWNFDTVMAESLSRHDITLVEESQEIVVRLQGQPATFSAKLGELQVLRLSPAKKHMISARSKAAYQLRFRNSDQNAVLLELRGFQPTEQSVKRAQIPADGEWRPAAVLRMNMESNEPSVWITEVRSENGRLTLKDAAGVTALGSPIWTETGLAGMLQDDNSGAVLNNILKSFSSERH